MNPDEFEAAYGVRLYRHSTRPAPGNPVVVIRPQTRDGAADGRGCWVWCPGCDMAHRPMIVGAHGDVPLSHDGSGSGPVWDWNGRDDEGFGISPSLLVRGGTPGPAGGEGVCHSFLKNGLWEFLGDSTHALAGQTVPMVPLPDWLVQ